MPPSDPSQPLSALGEAGLIARIAARTSPPPGGLGIGDDAALVPLASPRVLTATDVLVEGVHFRRETMPPADLGWKALAVNLSDVAAMGGVPTAALLTLSLPGDLTTGWVEDLLSGLDALAREADVWLAGGDTTGSPGPIVVGLTVLGEGPTGRPLLRSDARPGDVVFVTGQPGLAAAGFHVLEAGGRLAGVPPEWLAQAVAAHRRPWPQLAAGRALGALGGRLALLDDSDGLGRSAALLAEASGAVVVLEEAAIPIAPATTAIATALGLPPLELALAGGEDHHLVGACSPPDWPAVRHVLTRAGVTGVAVGWVEAPSAWRSPGVEVKPHEGPRRALAAEPGHRHFAP